MENFSPAISVIVPMYNAEKYLSVCLESILAQTFTDFELLVVDDCSTDSSLAVAESYLERFGGRLKIISLSQNTGSGAVPRNVGLDLSQGKYVYFVDADDLILDDALETLYDYAETFQAEIVYSEQGFHCGEEPVPAELIAVSWNPPQFISAAPNLEPADISVRIKKIFAKATAVTTCTKFLRRDFLVDNDIKFPDIRPSEDIVWTFKLICLAKKILRVPNPFYVYRMNGDSVTRRKRTPQDEIKFWLNPLMSGLDCLNEFMNDLEFFQTHTDYQFAVLNFFAKIQLDFMAEAFKSLEYQEVYKIFYKEFSKSNGNYSALISYLLVMTNLYRNEPTK